jgi:hypothetical protein
MDLPRPVPGEADQLTAFERFVRRIAAVPKAKVDALEESERSSPTRAQNGAKKNS